MKLRKRAYLGEGGKSIDIPIPKLSGAIGDTARQKMSYLKAMKKERPHKITKAIKSVVTWTKGGSTGDQWSAIRLTDAYGDDVDLFVNFYLHGGSLYAPNDKPFRVVVFDRRNTGLNLLDSYAKSTRDAKKIFRDWLLKYMEDNVHVKISRVSTGSKLTRKKKK